MEADLVKTQTVIGAKLKAAFVSYGGYIVDGTGDGDGPGTKLGGTMEAAICMDARVNREMREAYGFAMTYPDGVTSGENDPGKELYWDLVRIFQALHVVVNNSPSTVGGGGRPLVPRSPPICEQPANDGM